MHMFLLRFQLGIATLDSQSTSTTLLRGIVSIAAPGPTGQASSSLSVIGRSFGVIIDWKQ